MNRANHEPTPIAQLAAGMLRGEAAQTWELLQQAWGSMERFVRARLLGMRIPERLLEDCGQNVFTRVWQFRRTYRGATEGEFWRWVRQICDNERRRILRREVQRATMRLVPDDWSQTGEKALDCPDRTVEQVDLNEELRGLRECLRGLDGRYRRVIELAYFDPALTERAIAEVLRLSPSSVHKLKTVGLRLLQACLAREGIR